MQQAWNEDKQAAFHKRLIGQQSDLEQYSKFYWQPMKGMMQCSTARKRGDFVIKWASQFWRRWSLVMSVSVIQGRSELQSSRWLDIRAIASHHHHLSRSCHCWQMASTTCAMHFDPGPFSSIDCQRLPRCHLSISFLIFQYRDQNNCEYAAQPAYGASMSQRLLIYL